jgi:hypothetical protein
MRLIASGEQTTNRRRLRRVFVLFFAPLLVCWGAGPALASEETEAAPPDTAQATVDVADVAQPTAVGEPTSDSVATGEMSSTEEPAEPTDETTDIPTENSDDSTEDTDDSTDDTDDDTSSDDAAADSGADETDGSDTTAEPPPDPDEDTGSSTPTPSPPTSGLGSGNLELPVDVGEVDEGGGLIDTPGGQLPDSDVVDAGDGQVSESSDSDGSAAPGASDDPAPPASEETPQPDMEQTPDKESAGELPIPSDKEESTDNEKSEETDKTEDVETEVDQEDGADAGEAPGGDVIEDYVPTNTEVASDPKDETDSAKDRKSEPSPRAIRSDLNVYGPAYTGVKSGRSSSPVRDTVPSHEVSLAHLIKGGNRIEGTASFELVAEERKGQAKQSAQAIGKGFSLPFSNGFGMPLTGFDILVMSLMGLSLILVGVILFARGLERQSAARRSRGRRAALEASSPASRETTPPLSARIRGFKRKRVV